VIFSGAADPLAVADDQIAELAVGIELVEETIGVARPRDELVFHFDSSFFGEILAELDKGVGRIPCRPAQCELLVLRCRRLIGDSRQRDAGKESERSTHQLRPFPRHRFLHVAFPRLNAFPLRFRCAFGRKRCAVHRSPDGLKAAVRG
jgi:hypothetical protein